MSYVPACSLCGGPNTSVSIICAYCQAMNTYKAYTTLTPWTLNSGFQIPDEPKKKPEVTEGTSTECLIGYRAWRIGEEDGIYFLKSTYKDSLWPHKEKLARGEAPKPPEDTDPIKVTNMGGWVSYKTYYTISSILTGGDMSLGIHAIKERHKLAQLCHEYSEARVCGEVYLWGEVTETELGYRAQYAYPKQLWVMDDLDPIVIMALEDSYGVPVHVSDALTDCFKATKELFKVTKELQAKLEVANKALAGLRGGPSIWDPAGVQAKTLWTKKELDIEVKDAYERGRKDEWEKQMKTKHALGW